MEATRTAQRLPMQVERTAGQDEIDQAYRRQWAAYPSDPAPDTRLRELQTAYRILSDPEERRAYDERLAERHRKLPALRGIHRRAAAIGEVRMCAVASGIEDSHQDTARARCRGGEIAIGNEIPGQRRPDVGQCPLDVSVRIVERRQRAREPPYTIGFHVIN